MLAAQTRERRRVGVIDSHKLVLNGQESFYNRGVAYAHLQQPIMAVDDFTATLNLNPQHVDAYNNRAAAYLDLNQPSQAIKDAEETMRLDDRLPMAYAIRAMARAQLGQEELAKQDRDKARSLGLK